MLGGTATYAALAAVRGPSSTRSRFVVASLGYLVTTAVMIGAPSVVVVAVAGVGFGVSTAVLWVALQAAVLRLRPGQVGTAQAVVSGLSTVGVAVPPLIGLVADRIGLTASMWLFVLAPVGILLLAVTSRVEEGAEVVRA